MPAATNLGIVIGCKKSLTAFSLGLALVYTLASYPTSVYAQSLSGDLPDGYSDQPYRANPIYIVGERKVHTSVEIGGTVIPFREVTVTAQTPGRIDHVAGREGDRFQQGTVLTAINSDQLRARLEQASAAAYNAMLALRNAEVQYERERVSPRSEDINAMPGFGMPALFDKMFFRHFGSALGYGDPWLDRYSDLSTMGTQMGQARGQYQSAMWQMRELQARLNTTTTRAPFNGVVLEKMVEIGDAVQPGQVLMKFADLSRLQLTADVPARLVGDLTKGQILSAKLDVNGENVQVRLAQIYPMGNAQRHTIKLKFDLPYDTKAWPGTYAEIQFPDDQAGESPVLEIPASAVIQRGSLPIVFVVVDNREELRMVRLGDSHARDTVTVLSGLSVGDQVLINPPPGIRSREIIKASQK